jgi:hypothetical protein
MHAQTAHSYMDKRKQTHAKGWADLPPDVLQSLPLDPQSHMLSSAVSRHYHQALQGTVRRALKVKIAPVVKMTSAGAEPEIFLDGFPDLQAISAAIHRHADRLRQGGSPCMKIDLKICAFYPQEVGCSYRGDRDVQAEALSLAEKNLSSFCNLIADMHTEGLIQVASFSCFHYGQHNLSATLGLLNAIQAKLEHLHLHDAWGQDNENGAVDLLLAKNSGFTAPELKTAQITNLGYDTEHIPFRALSRLLHPALPQLHTITIQGSAGKCCNVFGQAANKVLVPRKRRLKNLCVSAHPSNFYGREWTDALETGFLSCVDNFRLVLPTNIRLSDSNLYGVLVPLIEAKLSSLLQASQPSPPAPNVTLERWIPYYDLSQKEQALYVSSMQKNAQKYRKQNLCVSILMAKPMDQPTPKT